MTTARLPSASWSSPGAPISVHDRSRLPGQLRFDNAQAVSAFACESQDPHRVLDVVDEPEHQDDVELAQPCRIELEDISLVQLEHLRRDAEVVP